MMMPCPIFLLILNALHKGFQMRYHQFRKFFGKMVRIKETSFLSTRGMILIFRNCCYVNRLQLLVLYQFLITGALGKPRPLSLFYRLTLGALAVVSTLSSFAIIIRKFEAYWKEKKLANNINVMINNVQGTHDQNQNRPILQNMSLNFG